MDEARGNIEIYKRAQIELSSPMGIQVARFVADDGDPQPMPDP